jgi:hypothetical protein
LPAIELASLCVAFVRAYAVLLLVNATSLVLTTAFQTRMATLDSCPDGKIVLVSGIASVVFLLATAATLIVYSRSLVRLLLAGVESKEVEIEADTAVNAAVAVVGLVVAIEGFEMLGAQAAVWFFSPKDVMTGSRPAGILATETLASGAIRALLGVLLVLGRRGLSRFLAAVRTLHGTVSRD